MISSTFYDTTPGNGVKETEWGKSAVSRGPVYGVVGADDLRITAHPSTPYTVNLGPGKFWGHGVWDESDAVVSVTCLTPAAGVTRWDLICAHRDWQPSGGGPTSLIALPGLDNTSYMAGKDSEPGVIDDQPLYLVQWKGGQTQPQQIIDLRCWAANSGVRIVEGAALQYLAGPGAMVSIGDEVWRYTPGANGVWNWRSAFMGWTSWSDPEVYGSGFRPYAASGWNGVKYRMVNGVFFLNGATIKDNNTVTVPAGTAICRVPRAIAPDRRITGVNCVMEVTGDVLTTGPVGPGAALDLSVTWPGNQSEV